VRSVKDRQLPLFPFLEPPAEPQRIIEVRAPAPDRVALLIDAENVSPRCWPRLQRIGEFLGTIVLARAYACTLSGWSGIDEVEFHHHPEAQGPDAADGILMMDAAVVQARDDIDTFVVASRDNGFATLAYVLVKSGATVHAAVPVHSATTHIPLRLTAAAQLTFLVPASPAPSRFIEDVRAAHAALAKPDEWVNVSNLAHAARQRGANFKKGNFRKKLASSNAFELRGKHPQEDARPLPEP